MNGTTSSLGNFKVMGVVYPTSVFNVGNQNVANAAIINNLVVGANMPFVNVYGKFNNHMYAAGTASPTGTAPVNGIVTLVNGTIDVITTAVTTASVIRLTQKGVVANLNQLPVAVTTINDNVSFVITGGNNSAVTVYWEIIA